MDRIVVLENMMQEYAWGSESFIPELIGEASPSKRPKAEMWMGSHPRGSSVAVYEGNRISLEELIRQDPAGTLGASIAKKFSNRLPFLFKVLAAARPLSIQAHPGSAQAKAGFERENSKKISLDGTDRSYRDENHKPELICALEHLWVLKGFRKNEEIIDMMECFGDSIKGLGIEVLRSQTGQEGIKAFFIALIDMRKDQRRSLLDEIAAKSEASTLFRQEFDWIRRLNRDYPGDIGVLSPIFLNLVHLLPTEAVHIHSGELHTYLEGAGLELMANSDNVIRGGLTSKHIDLAELVNILNFAPGIAEILRPGEQERSEKFYPVVAEEFMLSVISLNSTDSIYVSRRTRGAEIIICTKGDALVKDLGRGELLEFRKGMSAFIPVSVKQYMIQGEATIYKASVPL